MNYLYINLKLLSPFLNKRHPFKMIFKLATFKQSHFHHCSAYVCGVTTIIILNYDF